MVSDEIAIMIFAYAKATREDLSAAQKRAALWSMEELRDG
jgi:hypothetical protein